MTSKKAHLWRCDRYHRLLALWRGALILSCDATERPGPRALQLESSLDPEWDDLVEMREDATGARELVGWQVKLQSSPMAASLFKEMLRALRVSQRLGRGILAIPSDIPIGGAGELRPLKSMCERAQEPGCDGASFAGTLTEAQRRWWTFLETIAGNSPEDVLRLLQRLDVEFVPDAEWLKLQANLLLSELFVDAADARTALDTLDAFFSDVGDVAFVDAGVLEEGPLAKLADRRRPTARTTRTARRKFLLEVDAHVRSRPALAGLGGVCVTLDTVWVDAHRLRGSRELEGRSLADWLQTITSNGRTVVLLGDVGSGKTETLVRTAGELARRAAVLPAMPVPVLIEARMLVERGLEGAAVTRWKVVQEDVRRVLAALALPLVLLVDGLDEAGIEAEEAIEACRRQLGDRAHAIVVTTRPVLRPRFPKAIELWLEPWTAAESEAFLLRWEAVEAESVARLRQSPHRDHLAGLLENPLTATMCLLTAREEPESLGGRAKLFKSIVQRLYQQWSDARSKRVKENTPWKKVSGVLQMLALETVRQPRRGISMEDLRSRLVQLAPDEEEATESAIAFHLGVLVRRGDTYDFAVRGLAEHLAGRQLAEDGDDAVESASHEAWAEEAVRHAIGWVALRNPGREAVLLNRLLTGEEELTPGIRAIRLRPVLIAIRTAADVGAAAVSATARLVEAAMQRVTDEESTWVGDRVAEAVRELARAGGPCWESLFGRLMEYACDPRSRPANWYAGQTWTAAQWLNTLFVRDPEVRVVATDRLLEHVKHPLVQCFLVLQLRDGGHHGHDNRWLLPEGPPAIAAAAVLRQAPRDEAFEQLRGPLVRLLAGGEQLSACAAAVALRPDEADPDRLVLALRQGSQGFQFPIEVLRELEQHELGARALATRWSEWRAWASSHEEPNSYQAPLKPNPSGNRPPPSAWVRERIVRAVGPALHRAAVAQREHLLRTASSATADAMCSIAYDWPDLVIDILTKEYLLQSGSPSKDAQEQLGRAALRHDGLRNRLIHLVNSTDPSNRRLMNLLPARALEPLVLRGDTEAARAYARWLPASIWVWFHRDGIEPSVLSQSLVNDAATALIEEHLNGLGELTADPGLLALLFRSLRPMSWANEGVQRRIDDWLGAGDDRLLRAALTALDGSPLSSEMRHRIRQKVEASLSISATAGVLEAHRAAEIIRSIDRFAMGGELVDSLTRFTGPDSPVAIHAAAALISHLSASSAEALSASIAQRPWTRTLLLTEDRTLVRKLVQAAPVAWASTMATFATTHTLDLGLFSMFLESLPTEQLRSVAATWLQASTPFLLLPWRDVGVPPEREYMRPIDQASKMLFDTGANLHFRAKGVSAPANSE